MLLALHSKLKELLQKNDIITMCKLLNNKVDFVDFIVSEGGILF